MIDTSRLSYSIFQVGGGAEARVAVGGIAVLTAAIWGAMTGVLAAAMLFLFLSDLVLGVFRAIHEGGLSAFSGERAGRAFIKLGAGAVGIIMSVTVDLLLHELDVVGPDFEPATTAVLAGICWLFGWSAAGSLDYFFPGVGGVVRRGLRAIKDPRADDTGPPEGVEDRRGS